MLPADVNTVTPLDILEKRRLASRKFGFVRHQVYRTSALVQPPSDCTHYSPEEERLNKDFESVLKADHERSKAREKQNLIIRAARQAYREEKFFIEREKEWERKLEREHFLRTKPQGKVQANKSGVAYDFITMKYRKGYEGEYLKFLEENQNWRESFRRLRLQSKMSGTRNYNVISWQKVAPMKCVEKPDISRLPPKPQRPSPYISPMRQLQRQRSPRPFTAPSPSPTPQPVPLTPKVPDDLPLSAAVAAAVQQGKAAAAAAANYHHWELYDYRQRPYMFK